MDVTDLDRAQDIVKLNTNGAQFNGENLEMCYAPDNYLQLLEEYQPFVLWTVGQ